MTMAASGVAKLIEECGELTQILGKKLAYWSTDEHPDGNGSIAVRIEQEMADVQAAITFVAMQLGLDVGHIAMRTGFKLGLFGIWQEQPDNNDQAVDRLGDEARVREIVWEWAHEGGRFCGGLPDESVVDLLARLKAVEATG